jgi:hypothetical protein
MSDPRATAQRAVDALHEHSGNITAAARALDIARSTFRDQVEAGQRLKLVPLIKPTKPRIRVPARSVYTPQPDSFGKPTKVFVFGCAHDAPNIPDKSRFAHAGRLASELAPDYIVDLGDTLDMDSLSTHDKPGSMGDRERPFFKTEIASLVEALDAFNGTAPDPSIIPRYHLHGNHELRVWRYEASVPAAQGVFTTELEQAFARFNWTTRAYREWLFIGGVGFIHCPQNLAGKEYGGKTAENVLMNEATFSIVWSHVHRQHFVRRAKVGIGNGIASFNSGTFMPHGLIKPYAGLATTGWTYGAHLLTLRDGEIESAKTWSVKEMEERYV